MFSLSTVENASDEGRQRLLSVFDGSHCRIISRCETWNEVDMIYIQKLDDILTHLEKQ
jgi:hypothetical protein